MSLSKKYLNIYDLRAAASKKLPKGIFEYIDRGSEDEVAAHHNRECLDNLKLLPKSFRDLSGTNLSTKLFGQDLKYPLAISPTGVAGLCWFEGELALAKAAKQCGIPFSLATGSLTSIEKVAKEADGQLWFQLYVWQDEQASMQLIRRALNNGFKTLLVTVDIGLGNNREYNKRNGFSVPFQINSRSIIDVSMHPSWLFNVWLKYYLNGRPPGHANYPSSEAQSLFSGHSKKPKRNDALTWDLIDRIRELWPHNLVIKGILNPQDAIEAKHHGIDGIVVSNHGGRNLDSSVSSITMLPHIKDAVGSDLVLIYDSGVRRGSDIIKAIALGADCVMMGRPTLYGVATAGEEGAVHAIHLLAEESKKVMGYLGKTNIDELDHSVFAPSNLMHTLNV